MSDPKDTVDGNDYSDFLDDDPILEKNVDTIQTDSAVIADTAMNKPKRGIGWGAAGVLFLLSSVFGAAGGFAAVHYLKPAQAAAKPVNTAPLRARLDAAETQLSGQAAQLTLLQKEINNRPASITVKAAPMERSIAGSIAENNQDNVSRNALSMAPENTQAITDLQNQLSEMETALMALRGDLDGKLAASDITEGSETSPDAASSDAAPSDLIASDQTSANQTDALDDGRIEALQADITALRTRIDTLEGALSETQALASQPTIITQPLLLPAFPREAVFEALTQAPTAGDTGWVSKTLKKHISVRNPDDVKNAEQQLNNISDAIEAGDIARALSVLEIMPEAAQMAAKNWMIMARRGR